jgi:hypothetical protein
MTNPRKTATCLGAVLLTIAGWCAVQASAQVINSPGKQSAYMATPAFTVPGDGEKVVATVTILQPRKGDVLEADATLNVYFPADSVMYVVLRANGIPLYGADAGQDCHGQVACSIVAVGWLDLDDAEAAHPGVFRGKPLVVEMTAGNARVTVPSATASLRARLQSK